ncbi:hypothetical protein HDV00_003028 [Rhizophlyctis rosea]|nr:hypothetical protein HDV00_003028 [Rhizophlyctis rosea]
MNPLSSTLGPSTPPGTAQPFQSLLSLSPELLISIFVFVSHPAAFTKSCRAFHALSQSNTTRRAWLRAQFPRLPEVGKCGEFEFLDDVMGYAAPGFGAALSGCPVGLMGDEVLVRMLEEWGVLKGGRNVVGDVGDSAIESIPIVMPVRPTTKRTPSGNSIPHLARRSTAIIVTSTGMSEPARSIRLLLRLICTKRLESCLSLFIACLTSPSPTIRIAPDELGVLVAFAAWSGHPDVIDRLLPLSADTSQVVDDVLYHSITQSMSLPVLKRGVGMIPSDRRDQLLDKSIEWAVISAIPLPLSSPFLYGTGRRAMWTDSYKYNIDINQIVAALQTRFEKVGDVFEPSQESIDILSFLLRHRNAALSDLKIDYAAFSEPQLFFFIRTILDPSPSHPSKPQPLHRRASLHDPFLTYDIYELILTRDYHNLLRFLLSLGFPVSPDTTTHWPLRLACTDSSLNCVSLLLSHGADARTAGDVLLRDAAQRGNAPLVKLLCEYGADVKGAAGVDALCSAVRGGWVDVVEVLCRFGVEVGCLDETPLRVAVGRGCKGVVECLVRYGADVCRVLGVSRRTMDAICGAWVGKGQEGGGVGGSAGVGSEFRMFGGSGSSHGHGNVSVAVSEGP